MNERKKCFRTFLKRALVVCLCLVMALGTTVTIMAASFNGDLDGDGKITSFDAQLLAEYQAGNRKLDPATVIGLTIRDIMDRVLGRIIDEPVEEPSEDSFETTFEVKAEEGVVTEELTLTEGNITVTVPVGVMVTGAELTLTIKAEEIEGGDLDLEAGQAQKPLDIHIEGIADENTIPVLIKMAQEMETGLNQGNLSLYHIENGESVEMTQVLTAEELVAHNMFYYDPATGDVTVAMASFSVVRIVYTAAKWTGKADHSWYFGKSSPYTIANADQLWSFSQIVGGMTQNDDGTIICGAESGKPLQDSFEGKTVLLIADIDLDDLTDENDKVFYPIGYHCDDFSYKFTHTAVSSGFYRFKGTFDGQGHTIANFYQNTWCMKGDDNYYPASEQRYRDGMGLFGIIDGGTVKNLNIDNFSNDGEYTTTGTIAAYADGATFENIAIFNCNPRVYNIGNGGIVGCVGWYAKEAGKVTTFKNITVDNSNKISALWGSWDVACGGILGQYYPTSGQSSANYPVNGGVHFDNCHVAAQIDVYNDVCANYQYYAYRYAGILIGSIRENETINGHEYPKMDGITATNCTVHFGDWNDYYYCELVANSLASYTHDHQMSRLTQVQAVDVTNKQVTYLDGVTADIPTSGRVNYVVVKKTANGTWDHGDGEEHATCYHFVDGVQHLHDVADNDNPNVWETVDGQTVLVEDKQCIYREFDQLCTGYGWGVTSKGIGDLAGVTILDRVVGDSVVKFEGVKGVTEILSGKTYTLGELFTAAGNLSDTPINAASLQVAINDLTNDSFTDTIEFKRNADWTKSTVTIRGVGEIELIIQDYYFCAPTRINLSLDSHVHCLCGNVKTINEKCDDCGSVAALYDPVDTALTNNAEGHYYLTNNIAPEYTAYYNNEAAICLNGHTIQKRGGASRFVQLASGANVSLSDCTAKTENGVYTAGKITGYRDSAAVYIQQNTTFNMYDGIITDNTNKEGIVALSNSNVESERPVFNMYGGEISDNVTTTRGAVFTHLPSSNNNYTGEIHILGGMITRNVSHAQNKSGVANSGIAGGAGIYSFGPVYVGGDAKIFDNTCTRQSNKNPDIFLRVENDGLELTEEELENKDDKLVDLIKLFRGELIIEKALSKTAEINYGTSKAEEGDLKYIRSEINLDDGVVAQIKYDNDTVHSADNKLSTQHIHCLCGKDTVKDGEACAFCGSDAVNWTPAYTADDIVKTGYHYLRKDITKQAELSYRTNSHICLNGHDIISGQRYEENGNPLSDACMSVYGDYTVTLSDCDTQPEVGKITGSKHYASVKILKGATFIMYGGTIADNVNDRSSGGGTVWLQIGALAGSNIGTEAQPNITETTIPGGVFKMYGGLITRNQSLRGAVYTDVPSKGTPCGEIYLLGGEITDNIGTNADANQGGGAGVYSFGNVYIGGDIKVYNNRAAVGSVCADIRLRNGGATESADAFGQLIVYKDLDGAEVNYDTSKAESNLLKLAYISGDGKIGNSQVVYNNQQVSQANGTFYIDGTMYCMCGATTQDVCKYCNTEAVKWNAWTSTNSLPTSGNYFLTADLVLSKETPINSTTTINLNGHTIDGQNQTRFVEVQNGCVFSITDTSDEAGSITGFRNISTAAAAPIRVLNGATMNLYYGKITGNTYDNTSNNFGLINVADGGTFNMYGGELSGNTVTRGTVYGAAGGSVIRILGGMITNNVATSKSANDIATGGAGIYSFGKVYVGGTAQIVGNRFAEDANSKSNADVYLRTKGTTDTYEGQLILFSEKPLLVGAKVNYGTSASESANDMKYISFSGDAYDLVGQVTYNGQAVSYANGVFTYNVVTSDPGVEEGPGAE